MTTVEAHGRAGRHIMEEEDVVGVRVQNNIAAVNTYRNLQAADRAHGASLEKLSSGNRINRAADDAAGLAVSEGLRAQLGGLNQAVRNAQDGINFLQTLDGALAGFSDAFRRVRDLAVQAGNYGSLNVAARTVLQNEVTSLFEEMGDIESSARFAGTDIFANGTRTFQVGSSAGDVVEVNTAAFGLSGLSGTVLLNGPFAADVATSITTIGSLIDAITAYRAEYGAKQNRLEHRINALNAQIENITASESAIRDTDMAAEMTKLTKSRVLSQAGASMLAQANATSSNVLRLLRG